MVPIEKLHTSPDNPRVRFESEGLDELTASIRQHGVLQPLLVRPFYNAAEEPSGSYEVICGHRRLAGAKAAGLAQVPVTVRVATDDEVRQLQLIENLQRADLHPMDEAEAFERLARDHGLSAEEIAAKVGRSPSQVYQRMKLTALASEARKAFLEGALTPAVALLVARVPEALQADVLGRLARHDDLTTSRAREIVQGEFMLELKGAPFDASDGCLLAGVPACGACPKRTGSSPLLFDDVEKGDTCTDPGCFRAKADAAWEVAKAKSEAKGLPCVDDTAGKHSDWTGERVRSEQYADPSHSEWIEGEHRTWRSLVPKGQEPPVTFLRLKSGRTVKVWDRAEALKAARAAGTLKKAKKADGASTLAAKRKAAVDERVSVRIKQAALGHLRAAAPHKPNKLAASLICETKVHLSWLSWAWPVLGLESAGDLHKTAAKLSLADVAALAFAEAVQNADEHEIAKLLRLDPAKLRREAEEALKREETKAAVPPQAAVAATPKSGGRAMPRRAARGKARR
jgi:ParB/RepB/Spo0J family partition protein